MNKELKDKWLSALRSGEYTQGSSGLCVGDKFCCLGVLCDINDPTKWGDRPLLEKTSNKKRYYGESPFYAPYELVDCKIQTTLIRMNDIDGKSFRQIATWIADNVPVTP